MSETAALSRDEKETAIRKKIDEKWTLKNTSLAFPDGPHDEYRESSREIDKERSKMLFNRVRAKIEA
jgi:hypothetical protein